MDPSTPLDNVGETPEKEEADDRLDTLLHQIPAIPSIVPPVFPPILIQDPAQTGRAKATKRGGSRKGHPRRSFEPGRKKETAKTRKEKACDECRRKKGRCNELHRMMRDLTNASSTKPPLPSRQRNATSNNGLVQRTQPVGYQSDHSIGRFLTNPDDSRPPLIGSFRQMVPGNPDVVAGGFDASGSYVESRSSASFAPTQRIRKSSDAHSAHHNLGFGGPSFTRSSPSGQGDPSRMPIRNGQNPQHPMNAINMRPRPPPVPHRNRQYQNQNLQVPPRLVHARSLPPASEGLTQSHIQSANFNFSPRNSFPPPPALDPSSFSHAGTGFDEMRDSMTSNYPPVDYGYRPESVQRSPSPYPPSNHHLVPSQPPRPQTQAQGQCHGPQRAMENHSIMNFTNSPYQNLVSPNFPPAHSYNSTPAYISSPTILPQDNVEIDMSDIPNIQPSFNTPSPSFSWDDGTFGLPNYQSQSQPPPDFSSQEHVFPDPTIAQPYSFPAPPSANMGYNDTSFRDSGYSQRSLAPPFSTRYDDPGSQPESMTDFLNSDVGSFEDEGFGNGSFEDGSFNEGYRS